MKFKYILFAWVWPIFSMLLFVAAMLLLIHEWAFHNFNRPEKAYFAFGLLVITFINGWVAVLVSGHFKKPQKTFEQCLDIKDFKNILPSGDHPIKVKYMKRGICNDCGNKAMPDQYFCEICITKDCKN